ncbi:Copper homeostasis protein cutC [Balamuthia mandrillaris]
MTSSASAQEEEAGFECQVCVDSVESALAAYAAGAARVELCANLFEGGTTPSLGMIQQVRQSINNKTKNGEGEARMELHVMIRPRGGDFCYSDFEFQVMVSDITLCKAYVDGFVFGLLLPDGRVDTERTLQLVDLAAPLSVTFHRAIDMSNDLYQAMEDIIAVGARSENGRIDRILTSGGEATCLEGLYTLAALVAKANNRIRIVPGGGITERNIKKIMHGCGAAEFHISGRAKQQSVMSYRNESCFMGGALRPPEYTISVASEERIRHCLDACSGK